jgi:AraC family transcriptional regulator
MATHLRAGEFYGSTVSERIGGLVLSIVSHERERRLPAHTHALPFLCLLLEGRYEEDAAGETVRYEPLTLVFHPARLAHSDVVYPASRMFTVEFGDVWTHELEKFAPSQRSLYTHSGADPLWLMLRLYEALRDRTLNELSVQSLAYDLIGSFDCLERREHAAAAPWLRKVRTLLDERYASNIDLADLAGEIGIHPVHLSRTFRKALKTSVGDYVHRRRIQQACRMLHDTGMPIAGIAEDLGYVDQSHFSRVFRSITGKTPARYRAAPR